MSPAGARSVALLRGINLGGRRIPMPALAALFERAGATRVQTYIASGNVVYAAPAAKARVIPAVVSKAIARDHGFECPIVVRTAAQLAKAVRENPFAGDGANEDHLYVGFLPAKPAAARVAALDAARSPGDAFRVIGANVHLQLTHGAAKTKLTTDWFDRGLATVMTVRNWRTVGTLLEMARA